MQDNEYMPYEGENDENKYNFDNVDPSFGVDTESGTDTDLSDLYTTDENDEESEKSGGINIDPSDETAATCDSDCGCDSVSYAQERCSLDDYEIISDVLGAEKQLVKLYSTALCESAEEPLRDILRENLIEAAADQYETFEYISSRGLYKTEQADDSKVDEAKRRFTAISCDCGCGN